MVATIAFCGCPEARSTAFSPKYKMSYHISQQNNLHKFAGIFDSLITSAEKNKVSDQEKAEQPA